MPSDIGYSDDGFWEGQAEGGDPPGQGLQPQTMEWRYDRDGAGVSPVRWGPWRGSPGRIEDHLVLYGAGGDGAQDDPAAGSADHVAAANAVGQILQPAVASALAAPEGSLTHEGMIDRTADALHRALASGAVSPDHFADLVGHSLDFLTGLPPHDAGIRQNLMQLGADHAATLDLLNGTGAAGGSGGDADPSADGAPMQGAGAQDDDGWLDPADEDDAQDEDGDSGADGDPGDDGEADDDDGAQDAAAPPAEPAPRAAPPLPKPVGARVARPAASLGLSGRGLDFIKTHEGFKPKVYKDVAGYDTIGYGHKLRGGEAFPRGVDDRTASSLLATDAAKAVRAVQRGVKAPLTQNQFDALVSFAFNAGVPAFQGSTLLKRLNGGDYAGAAAQISRWNKAHVKGKVVENKGLTNRRAAERALFEGN